MKMSVLQRILLGIIFSTVFISLPNRVLADCNSTRKPIVRDALKALDSKNVSWVLKWVYKDRDQEIKDAFDRALKERAADSSKAKTTDNIFFETVLRVHCEGENIPYSEGVMPGKEKADSLLEEMDRSLATGYADDLVNMASRELSKEIRERFEKVDALEALQQDSIDAGRRYVEAYLDLAHYLENIKARQAHKH